MSVPPAPPAAPAPHSAQLLSRDVCGSQAVRPVGCARVLEAQEANRTACPWLSVAANVGADKVTLAS